MMGSLRGSTLILEFLLPAGWMFLPPDYFSGDLQLHLDCQSPGQGWAWQKCHNFFAQALQVHLLFNLNCLMHCFYFCFVFYCCFCCPFRSFCRSLCLNLKKKYYCYFSLAPVSYLNLHLSHSLCPAFWDSFHPSGPLSSSCLGFLASPLVFF